MSDDSQKKSENTTFNLFEDLYIKISIKKFIIGTVSLPLIGLVICIVSALLFSGDDIYKTDCGAFNVLPSISSVIGISPQRYIWRICIGLHSFNRFLICFAYYELYKRKLINKNNKHDLNSLILNNIEIIKKMNFISSILEIGALILITYVSNKENFKLHELGFILFTCASMVYMLTTILLQCELIPVINMKDFIWSYKVKKATFQSSLIVSILLALFFYIHRIYCIDNTFSIFCFCEYIVVLLNIVFHSTAIYDFQGSHIIMGNINLNKKD